MVCVPGLSGYLMKTKIYGWKNKTKKALFIFSVHFSERQNTCVVKSSYFSCKLIGFLEKV